MESKFVCLIFLGAVVSSFGSPALPNILPRLTQPLSSTVSLAKSVQLLNCLGLNEVGSSLVAALQDLATGSSGNKFLSVFNAYKLETYQLGDGIVGNGSVLCGNLWAGDLKLLNFRNGTCLLGGSQTFFQNELVNGYMYFLCNHTFSSNYVQFFNGTVKLLWNFNTTSSYMNLDFGPLGVGYLELGQDKIVFQIPNGYKIVFLFTSNKSSSANPSTASAETSTSSTEESTGTASNDSGAPSTTT